MSAKDEFFQKYDNSKNQKAAEFAQFGSDILNSQTHMKSLVTWIDGWVSGVNEDIKCDRSTTAVVGFHPYRELSRNFDVIEIRTRYKRLSIVPSATQGNATQVVAVAYLNDDVKSKDLGTVLFEFQLQNNTWVIVDPNNKQNASLFNEPNFFTAIMPLV